MLRGIERLLIATCKEHTRPVAHEQFRSGQSRFQSSLR
jgi:hypothetical protein